MKTCLVSMNRRHSSKAVALIAKHTLKIHQLLLPNSLILNYDCIWLVSSQPIFSLSLQPNDMHLNSFSKSLIYNAHIL